MQPAAQATPRPGKHDKVACDVTAQRWDLVFRTKDTHQVSWYQDTHGTSLRLIADTPGSVIDVRAGISTLVDDLLANGRTDLTVLDISESALELTRRRLANRAGWSVSRSPTSSTGCHSAATRLWHDRAVFHFLTDVADQSGYVDLATRAVSPGGTLVLGTLAKEGPTHCSGLPTARNSAESVT